MCNNEDKKTSCLAKTFELILLLQQRSDDCPLAEGCDKPFLGPTINSVNLNTRPFNLYSCCNNTLWTMPYTLNGTEGTSSVFRIENIDDNCITCHVLAPNPDTTSTTTPYLATDDFFTIKLSCIGALKCLNDVLVPGID